MPSVPVAISFLIFFLAITIQIGAQVDFEPQTGKCSYYANSFHGKPTASGEKYDKQLLTCAHRSLPFGTLLKVTNLSNNRWVIVKVNDRGPYHPDRILDLSYAAADSIDLIPQGVAVIYVELYDPLKEKLQPKDQDAGNLFKVQSETITPAHYSVCVVELDELSWALQTAADLKRKGVKEVFLESVTEGGKEHVRVLAGNTNDKSEADLILLGLLSTWSNARIIERK